MAPVTSKLSASVRDEGGAVVVIVVPDDGAEVVAAAGAGAAASSGFGSSFFSAGAGEGATTGGFCSADAAAAEDDDDTELAVPSAGGFDSATGTLGCKYKYEGIYMYTVQSINTKSILKSNYHIQRTTHNFGCTEETIINGNQLESFRACCLKV